MTLRMLYHLSFYDTPLTGVGIYNEEKVYFEQKCGGIIKCFTIDEAEETFKYMSENKDIFQIPDDVIASIKGFVNTLNNIPNDALDDNFNDLGLEIGDYTATYDGCEIFIDEKFQYNIYRLSVDDMEQIDKNHKYFQEKVGYHTDHDPNVYKPFRSPIGWIDFYKKTDEQDTRPASYTINTIQNKEYITTVYQDNIDWMSRLRI